MPMVAQLLLQLGDGLAQRQDLLLALVVLVEPVGDLVRAAEHIRAALVIQLGQRGHQFARAVLHRLVTVLAALRRADPVRVLRAVVVARPGPKQNHQEGQKRPSLHLRDSGDSRAGVQEGSVRLRAA